MSKELVISANRHETRVALTEDDQLVEVYFQRSNEYSLAGSIHKGRVTRVLPGMQSAFVDLGLERDTFLYVSDFLEEHEDIDKVTDDDRPARQDRERDRDRDRGGRERRQAMQPRAIEPRTGEQTPTAPPDARELPAAENATLAAPEAGPAPVRPPGDREARPDARPDRGDQRRGRRRRRRGGKGFPESKYAGTPSEEAEGSDDADAEPVADNLEPAVNHEAAPMEAAIDEPAIAPLILPGESLRKYRGPSAIRPAMIPHAPPSSPAAPPEEKPHVMATPEPPASHAAPPPIAESLPPALTAESGQPERFPLDNAIPDAPIHHPKVDAGAYTPELERRVEPPPLPLPAFPNRLEEAESEAHAEHQSHESAEGHENPEGHEHLDSQDQESDPESGPASGPLIASILDEDEDLDIQAMILNEIEGLTEEDGPEDESQPPAEPGVDATPLEGETGTAQVRERGGRFPHRVSRRTRRRGRGGPGGGPEGGRPQQESRPEQRPEARAEGAQAREEPRERVVARPATGQVLITDLLKEGQEIIVQIAKEPLGQKGARITSHIALPGRYVVFMPTLEHMGVSRKIASDEERQRLKKILQGRRPGPMGGFITRTAAEGRSEEEIASDMEFLYKLWQDIRTKADRKPAPLLLHHDLDIVERILRDQLTDNFKAIWIDNEDVYEHVLGFVQRFQPALVNKVKMYTREAPIFDAFGVTAELEKALRPKVWLKSGGYIVINQTEALVAIDVNTGKFVGKSNRLEDTIVKTNTEAIREIVRQIRLRDLGGIIVIDFIDMDERKNRQKVMQVLEETMRADRAPYKILQFNDFGLVAITRKRVKQSLERTLCAPCPHCDGAGYIKSVQTVVSEILTEARKMSGSVEGKDVMLRVHPDVAKILKSHQNKYLEELEETLRRPVLVKSDPLLHHEKFDLA
jgi:ribonuclease G